MSPAKKPAAKKKAPARPSAPAAKAAAPVKKPAPVTKTAIRVAAAKVPAKAPAHKSAPSVTKASPVAKATKQAPPAAKKTAPPVKKPAPARKLGASAVAVKKPTRGPYASDTKFLDEQRALLLEERLVYQRQAEDLRAEAESLALEREPGDVQFDEESGEGGTVAVDRERDLTLSAQALATIEEIDFALLGIEAKTYGACENCGQPIPKARLRALPYARLCVGCKSGGLHRR